MASRAPQPADDTRVLFERRRYARFSATHGVYCVPIDTVSRLHRPVIRTKVAGLLTTPQLEEKRLNELHDVVHGLFGERSVLPPGFPSSRLERDSDGCLSILDCGFGTGVWIESFLEEYGGSEFYTVSSLVQSDTRGAITSLL